MAKPIYLDHHATTPTDKRVVDAMVPYFSELFGNVGSQHCFGEQVRKACQTARQQVASLIGADASEIIFTSGATESDNMAIKGIAEALESKGRHIITSSIEHKAVLDSCRYLQGRGFVVTYLEPDENGEHSAAQVADAIRNGDSPDQKTILISIMGANNEIGVINPIGEIAAVAKKYGILFHCDGAQTVGKVPFDVKRLGTDLVSLSGHKIYGPKGIGALYVANSTARTSMVPLFHGGGQEYGMRSGTLPVPLIVGLGKACEICQSEMHEENRRLEKLRAILLQKLRHKIGSISVNGTLENRLPGNLNVCFSGIDAEFLAFAFKDVAVSQTSACSSDAAKPSYVLKALGLSDKQASSSIRFGLGRCTTEADIQSAVDRIQDVYRKFGEPIARQEKQIQEAGY